MLDQKKEVPADAQTGWVDSKSKTGQGFRVKASEYDISTATKKHVAALAHGPAFKDVEVYWTLGSSGAPTQDVQNRTGITWYKLAEAPWYSPWDHELTINTTKTYNYHFTDQWPDTYDLNVFINGGSHYVQYDSGKPTIVKISGD